MTIKILGRLAPFLLVGFLLPNFAHAEQIKTFQGLVDLFTNFIRQLIPFTFLIALLFFLYNVAQYIMKAGEQKAREEARQYVIYGLMGLFVMMSVWGLVTVIQNTLKLDNTKIVLPKF